MPVYSLQFSYSTYIFCNLGVFQKPMQPQFSPSEFASDSNQQATDLDLDHNLMGYDYELPSQMIAQNPVVPRDRSRLLVVNSPLTGVTTPPIHMIFRNLPEFLQPGDLLVMNKTKVIPARLYGYKNTGAIIEVLLLEERSRDTWLALVKPGRRFKIGSQIMFVPPGVIHQSKGEIEDLDWDNGEENHLPEFDPNQSYLKATVIDSDANTGGRILEFDLPEGVSSLIEILHQYGEIPLPPYIKNSTARDEQYQTVYADSPGSVAAPTAGLHFTPELLENLQNMGIGQAFVTLHVGVGTFRPVEVEDVTTHVMHEEWIEVTQETVEQVRSTLAQGGRIIAVGTTAVRSLEGAASISGELQAYCGKTNLFIYPGYQWRVVDGLITNFHLPRSSLMMLVSALIGRERLLNLYQEAIRQEYRFYSFGDAMLILPEGREYKKLVCNS